MSNFIQSFRSDLLKTKRSSAFWISLLGGLFVPVIFLLVFLFNSKKIVPLFQKDAWKEHLLTGWESISFFLLPLFIILIISLVVQIEFKNNTWKQVFASPQSLGNIFFSKLLTIHFLILFFFFIFSTGIILAAVIANLFIKGYPFLKDSINWLFLLRIVFKIYISILGLSAIQYALSLRFKNFVAPVGIGLALYIGATIANAVNWKYLYLNPFASSGISIKWLRQPDRPLIENTEWVSIFWFLALTAFAFWDLSRKKEKG